MASEFRGCGLEGLCGRNRTQRSRGTSHSLGCCESITRTFIRVNIFLISNGIVPHDPPKNDKLKGFDDSHYQFSHLGHRTAPSPRTNLRLTTGIQSRIDLREINGSPIPCLAMPSENEVYECYLAIVPGKLLATLYRNYGTRLLESNVRAFLQQTGKVNKGIMQTIRNAPEMFLPYNNGLAATASDVPD